MAIDTKNVKWRKKTLDNSLMPWSHFGAPLPDGCTQLGQGPSGDFGEKLNNFMKMLPRDGTWLIASKNGPDVGDMLTAMGAPSGVLVPLPNIAMAAVPPEVHRHCSQRMMAPTRYLIYKGIHLCIPNAQQLIRHERVVDKVRHNQRVSTKDGHSSTKKEGGCQEGSKNTKKITKKERGRSSSNN